MSASGGYTISGIDNLVFYMDADNTQSYSTGSGTISDIARSGSHAFLVDASSFKRDELGVAYWSASAGNGIIKRSTDIGTGATFTVCLWSIVSPSISDWRTLLRSYTTATDHQVIIQTGANDIGYYDALAAFITSGFNITSVPNYSTQWNYYCFVLQQVSPYWSMYVNGSKAAVATITNTNAAPAGGFASIGGYTTDLTAPLTGNQQYWGRISQMAVYNKVLSVEEMRRNYLATVGRYRRQLF